jgi:rsbT co-antagonist protein RsbR
MALDITKILKTKKKLLFEAWMQNQLASEALREDLVSNQDLRVTSEELIDALLQNLTPESLDSPNSGSFDAVLDILAGISMERAQQGFSPRETGLFVLSLKEALLTTLHEEIKDAREHSTSKASSSAVSWTILRSTPSRPLSKAAKRSSCAKRTRSPRSPHP